MEVEESTEAENSITALINQFKCCLGLFLTAFITGMSWNIKLHNRFRHKEVVNPIIYTYISKGLDILPPLTTCFGSHFIGRRNMIVLIILLYAGDLVVTASSSNPVYNFIGSNMLKWGRGMIVVMHTMYVSEVCQAKLRASFIGGYYLAFDVGVFIGRILPDYQLPAFLTSLLSLPSWIHTSILFDIVLNAIALALVSRAPETPYYLAMVDRRDEAEQVMSELWTGTADAEVAALLDKADQYAVEYQEGILPILTSGSFAVPLLICLFLAFANFKICILFYTPTLNAAQSYGYEPWKFVKSEFWFGIQLRQFLLEIFHILGSFFYVLLCLVLERRTIFIFSTLSSLCFYFVWVLTPLGESALVVMYMCDGFQRMGLTQVSQTVPAEIFPSTARDAGIGLSYLIHFIFYNRQHSYYTIFYGQVENKMFSIILLICFPLGFLLTFLFMPETKDLPLTVTEDLGENLVLQPLQGLFAHEEEEIDDSYA